MGLARLPYESLDAFVTRRRFAEQHAMKPTIAYPFVFRWNRLGRKGQCCRVLCRGRGSIAVEFTDGYVVITSWRAVGRAKT